MAYVFLEDGTDVNAETIKQGYGFAYLKYPFKKLEPFRQLGNEAREQEKGLWADKGLREFEWLLDKHSQPFKIYAMAGGMWAVRYEDWVKTHVEDAELVAVLLDIRRWSVEFSERDLSKKVAEAGWLRQKENANE